MIVVPIEYVGSSVVADRLGVTRQAVTMWVARHSESIPAPVAYCRTGRKRVPLWTEEQLEAWAAWWAQRRHKFRVEQRPTVAGPEWRWACSCTTAGPWCAGWKPSLEGEAVSLWTVHVDEARV